MRWFVSIGLVLVQSADLSSKDQLIGQLTGKTIIGKNIRKNINNSPNIKWDTKKFIQQQIPNAIMPFGVNKEKLVEWYNKINSRLMRCENVTFSCKCSWKTSENDKFSQISYENAADMVNFLFLTALNDFNCDERRIELFINNTEGLKNFWWSSLKHTEGNCHEVTKNLYDRISLRMMKHLEKDDFDWQFHDWSSIKKKLPDVNYKSNICDPFKLINSKYIQPIIEILASDKNVMLPRLELFTNEISSGGTKYVFFLFS